MRPSGGNQAAKEAESAWPDTAQTHELDLLELDLDCENGFTSCLSILYIDYAICLSQGWIGAGRGSCGVVVDEERWEEGEKRQMR